MRLSFEKNKQKELIQKFREKENLTWKQLSQNLKIKEGRLKAYFDETSLMPEEIYSVLDKEKDYARFIIDKRPENWGKKKGGTISRGKTKQIKYPKNSRELAEFYGIMLGDGNSNKTKGYRVGSYSIRIVGDSRYDREYLLKYVKPIIEKLFDIKVRSGLMKGNTMLIEAHSLNLVNFLESKGFKPGNKIKNELRIPDWIKKNQGYLKVCLRGLFDTDGSFYKLTNQNSCQIHFSSYNPGLLEDVRDSLLSIGINCSKISKGNSIYITKKEEITKFFKLVGFKNSKHLNRIKMFRDVVP